MLEQDQVTSASAPSEGPTMTGAQPRPMVELYNDEGTAPVLVVCDHAGRDIPDWLGDLGLPEHERARHIGWDIGAADATRRLAVLLDAPAVLCHVSRLVIDPNRDPGTPSSIPAISDGTFVPGNQDLSADEIRRRLRLSFVPYHRTVSRQIARLRRRHGVPVILSMHTMTPRMGHTWRPWDVAVLSDRDRRLADPLLAALRRDPELAVGDNEPYSGAYPVGYTIPFHAVRPRLPHVSFELRQDLVETRAPAEQWAELLAEALRPALGERTLYRLHRS